MGWVLSTLPDRTNSCRCGWFMHLRGSPGAASTPEKPEHTHLALAAHAAIGRRAVALGRAEAARGALGLQAEQRREWVKPQVFPTPVVLPKPRGPPAAMTCVAPNSYPRTNASLLLTYLACPIGGVAQWRCPGAGSRADLVVGVGLWLQQRVLRCVALRWVGLSCSVSTGAALEVNSQNRHPG